MKLGITGIIASMALTGCGPSHVEGPKSSPATCESACSKLATFECKEGGPECVSFCRNVIGTMYLTLPLECVTSASGFEDLVKCGRVCTQYDKR